MAKKIVLPNCTYRGSEGGLASPVPKRKQASTWNWTHCREVFHRAEARTIYGGRPRKSKTSKLLYFSKNVGNSIAFIKKAEDLLKLPTSKKAKIYRTNIKNVICISYGSWWSITPRRELFTIFLRIGRGYNVKGKTEEQKTRRWWKIAKKNKYLTNSTVAFQKFMEGRNKLNTDAKVKVPTYDYLSGKVKEVEQPLRWGGWCNTLKNLDEKQAEQRLMEG